MQALNVPDDAASDGDDEDDLALSILRVQQYIFPFPGQKGAPYFEGRNVTKFLTNWEDLMLGWAPVLRVKKIPLYCDDLVGKYICTLDSYQEVDRRTGWRDFKKSLLAEFKEED